jgi:cephalosporin hydroxylase
MLSASLLALLDRGDELQAQDRSHGPARKVLGIDIEIRPHNRSAILDHPFSSYIQMIEGSSISQDVIDQVTQVASGYSRILVCLDSNHTFDHVYSELLAYAPLVTSQSYCIVYDTVVEYMRPEFRTNRTWGPGNSPLTAVQKFLADHPSWQIDRSIDQKLQITVARSGFLRRL